MRFFSFENLEVYQLAQEYAVDIYVISEVFPVKEQFGITNQLRRAAGSISFNIAEGNGRGSPADFTRFLIYSPRLFA